MYFPLTENVLKAFDGIKADAQKAVLQQESIWRTGGHDVVQDTKHTMPDALGLPTE